MKNVFLIIILTVSYNFCFSQTNMSKKEILLEWNKIETLNEKRLEELGSQLKSLPFEPKVISFIDSLKKKGVDTIGVFNQVSVGYYSLDSCDNETSPWISYVQWEKDGLSFHKTIRRYCENPIITIPYSTIIHYYNNCPTELKKEKIIPPIKTFYKDKDGKLNMNSVLSVDHTIHYSIFCKQSNDFILKRFTEYSLEEKQSLFYEDNNKSRIKSWMNMIESQIKEIENE